MWTWITIGAVIIIPMLTYWRMGVKQKRWPPGPSGLPMLGYLPFIGKPYHIAFKELSEQYGPILRLQLGFKNVVVLNDLPSIQEALRSRDVLYRPDNFIFRELGCIGILAMNGEQWNANRRYCFHALRNVDSASRTLEKHIEVEVLHLVDLLTSKNGVPTTVAEPLGSSLANVMSALVFGQRFRPEEPGGRFIERLSTKLLHSESFFSFMDFFPGIRALLAKIPRTRIHNMKRLMEEMAQLVTDEMSKREGTKKKGGDRNFLDGYLRKIQEGTACHYSLRNLQGNVTNIYGAATNPVRRAILWCLYIVATDLDGHQATVQREIDAIVGRERTPEWGDRHCMPFTVAFIQETLRWRTITPISVHRVAGKDTILCGYHIPAGTFVVPNLWSLHNDSGYWRMPHMFDPTRFLNMDGAGVDKKPHAFLPFSHGKRSCPGETIALEEIFLYVTTLLQKFRVLPEEGKPVSLESGATPRAVVDHTQLLRFVARCPTEGNQSTETQNIPSKLPSLLNQ